MKKTRVYKTEIAQINVDKKNKCVYNRINISVVPEVAESLLFIVAVRGGNEQL